MKQAPIDIGRYIVEVRLKVGSLIAIALLACIPCESQSHLRSVSGLVTDKRGNTLPGTAVELENMIDLRVRSYITQKDGRYQFTGLNDDVDYVLRANYRNHWSKPKTLSKFDSETHSEVNLVIPID